MAIAIGYIYLVSQSPRTWRLCDSNGNPVVTGDFVTCKIVADNRGVTIVTVH